MHRYKCIHWFAACIALRVIGAVLVIPPGIGVQFAKSSNQWEGSSGGQNDDFRPLTYTLGGRGMGCRDKYVTS